MSRQKSVWIWGSGAPRGHEIIRYRIRKPRGLTILQELLADMPENVES